MSIQGLIDSIELGLNEKYTEEELKTMLAYPDMMPCDFDQTFEAWLYRISLWGKINIVMEDPENGVKSRDITNDQFLSIIGDKEDNKAFGTWHANQISVNKIEFYRKYMAFNGRYYTKKLIVDVSLNANLKKAVGKVIKSGFFRLFGK